MSKAGASTFRFTIRDVLWLTVVVALGVGWFVDRWQLDADRAQAWNNATLRR